MKKRLLFIANAFILLAWQASAQESVLNGGFESWTTTSFENPTHYVSSNIALMVNSHKVTDAYHGTYAIKVETHDDLNIGFVSNYTPNSMPPWHGGLAYNQKPAGLRGYCIVNSEEGDSATILVNFSKEGQNIGLYMFKIGGSSEEYEPFVMEFDPPLEETPDSVIILFTSSDALNMISIPGSSLTIDSISFTGVAEQPDWFNGDFEQWESFEVYTPEDWYQDIYIDSELLTRTTDSRSGEYAVELTTYLGMNDGRPAAEAQQLTNTYWDWDCSCEKGGSPFSNSVDTLIFWYKYNPLGGDSAFMDMNFYKDGESLAGIRKYITAAADYTEMMVPFDIYQEPDTVRFRFMSSDWTDTLLTSVGTTLILDDIHFASKPLASGIKNYNSLPQLSVFPNPGKGVFTLTSKLPGSTLQIFNSAGTLVFATRIDGESVKVDMGLPPKGLYMLQLKNERGQFQTGKLIIE